MSKCKIGQSVYLLYKHNNQWAVHEDLFVIQRVSQDQEGHHYSLVGPNEDIIDWCYDVYGSEAEAIEVMIERNLKEE